VNIRAITSMKSRLLAGSTTSTVINRLERTHAEPPIGAASRMAAVALMGVQNGVVCARSLSR
jgi:hypothetical protein